LINLPTFFSSHLTFDSTQPLTLFPLATLTICISAGLFARDAYLLFSALFY